MSSGANNESFVNLSKIRPVFEPGSCEEQFERGKSSEMDDNSEISNDQTPPRDGSGSDSYDADQSLNPPSGNNDSRSSKNLHLQRQQTNTISFQLQLKAQFFIEHFMIFIAISAVVLVIAIVIGMHLKVQSHDENESWNLSLNKLFFHISRIVGFRKNSSRTIHEFNTIFANFRKTRKKVLKYLKYFINNF